MKEGIITTKGFHVHVGSGAWNAISLFFGDKRWGPPYPVIKMSDGRLVEVLERDALVDSRHSEVAQNFKFNLVDEGAVARVVYEVKR